MGRVGGLEPVLKALWERDMGKVTVLYWYKVQTHYPVSGKIL